MNLTGRYYQTALHITFLPVCVGWCAFPTMFHVVKIHDCGAILQAEMRPPLFQREMLRPIAFDFGMATPYLFPWKIFCYLGRFFLGEDRTDGG